MAEYFQNGEILTNIMVDFC